MSLPLFDETPPPPRTELVCADVLAWAQGYTGLKFHAILCDPPYSLGDGTKGFMNKAWDTAIAFQPDTWKALAEHLLPGAFIMAFGGSRTYHRLACALEDAGLIVHPAQGWLQSQGFPKATRIPHECFSGHRYGLQALKPAIEFIAVAQKPYQGKPVHSITETGAGALNIDGGRTAVPGGLTNGGSPGGHRNPCYMSRDGDPRTQRSAEHPDGRWPPNFALTHHPECQRVGTQQVKASGVSRCFHKAYEGTSNTGFLRGNSHPGNQHDNGHGQETVSAYRCHPDCPVNALDQQAGTLHGPGYAKSSGGHKRHRNQSIFTNHKGGIGQDEYGGARYGDSGYASRFFHTSDFALEVAESLAQASPVLYAPKASRAERNHGIEHIPKEITHAHCVHQCELDLSCARNWHPTVKPALSLCQWLATLLLPPAAYAPRRLLNPFSGSGSEAIGALLAGWDAIVLVEREVEYLALAEARLAYWAAHREGA
jgi:hypothetical protein